MATDRYRRSHRLLLLLLIAHVLIITLFAWIARFPVAVWDDMLEAWAWGKQFELGYYKHPPLYAWVTGIWFKIFPRTDFAFYSLSALNIGLGLAGIWRLSGLLLKKYARFPAVALLLFAPSHHYFATNFNANTIQLSVWPWATFFFVRSLQTKSWKDGGWFGVIGGCALLGKYYSILFLASCFVSALVHPDRRCYFRSAAPYCAVLACSILFAPHAWWAWENGLVTVHYALGKGLRPWWQNTYSALNATVVGFLANAASTAVLLVALGQRWPALISKLGRSWMAHENLWLTVLGVGPLLLTVLLGVVGYIKVTPNYLIPTVYLLPLLACRALGATLTNTHVGNITRWAAAFMLFSLSVAPVIAYTSVALRFEDKTQVSRQVARLSTNLWKERFATPLRIATGTEPFSLALPFYSPDSPAEFTHYSLQQAPWITRELIAREGILYACAASDKVCLEAARVYATERTEHLPLTIQNNFWGLRGPPTGVALIITAPIVKR